MSCIFDRHSPENFYGDRSVTVLGLCAAFLISYVLGFVDFHGFESLYCFLLMSNSEMGSDALKVMRYCNLITFFK